MFQALLQDVVDHTDGGLAGLLMGYDGIAVDHYVRAEDFTQVEAVGMELSVVLKNVQQATQMLEAGDAEEVAIRAAHFTTLVRLLNDEYFVAVTVRPGGNVGKARYLLRKRAADFDEALR